MEQWLVRTAANLISGPYTKSQVIQMIQEGKLGSQDEVCQANHYWIFLHEHEEVQSQLGIQLPRSLRSEDDEEITETQTEALAVPEVEERPMHTVPSDYEGGTAVLSQSGTFTEARTTGFPGGSTIVSRPAAAPRVQTVSRPVSLSPQPAVAAPAQLLPVERSSIWRGFAWALIVAGCLVILAVLRLLRSPHY